MGEGEGEAAAGGGQELFENLQADSDTEEAAEERSHDQQIDFLNRKARERQSHLAEVFHTTVHSVDRLFGFFFFELTYFPNQNGQLRIRLVGLRWILLSEFGWLDMDTFI